MSGSLMWSKNKEVKNFCFLLLIYDRNLILNSHLIDE